MDERAWFLRPGFVISGVFLGVLVLVAVAVFASDDTDRTASRAVRAPGHAGGSSRAVATGGSRCGLPVGPTDRPVGPPDATWKLVGVVAAPSSPVFGPAVQDGARRVCFAHSPTGALFAAANHVATIAAHGSDVPLMRDILAETHARNVLMRQNSEPDNPSDRAQIAGFHVTEVNRNFVIVDLAVRTNVSSTLAAISVPMRWEQRPGEGGDWRLMITNVDQPYSVTAIADNSSVVTWSGA